MESIERLYRIGRGPSSSHTMGPARAAADFGRRFPGAARFEVTLFGSLAATGRGHGSDTAITEALAPRPVHVLWQPEVVPATHPNGMRFEAWDAAGARLGAWEAFSVGGGAILGEGWVEPGRGGITWIGSSMAELLAWCESEGRPLWACAERQEGAPLWDFLHEIWRAMQATMEHGLQAEGRLPGGLRLERRARACSLRAQRLPPVVGRTAHLAAYALACSEENAAGGQVVTAPTCGACGIVPAVLRYVAESLGQGEREILRALATAGLVGCLVKRNASISGAEVGCQGEVGTACAMAAAGAAWMLGGTPRHVEYAAEMGLEHHLGLTCDPVQGLVQIPCIERNAVGAMRALDCAEYVLLSDGQHRISFDTVVETMRRTGRDLAQAYRETATGGLASTWQ